MQVRAYMKTVNSRTAQTRARLLQAAAEVFAQAGVTGATTKEIARRAQVNEVTLFRHFQSKEQLLAAVVAQALALQTEALAHEQEWTGDLRRDLSYFAGLYNQMLEEQEDLIRTFIGEAKRHPEAARRVISEAAQPIREQLAAYLRLGQERGTVSPEVDVTPTVDLFMGMLLAGMLRRNVSPALPYSRDRYLKSCVDLFVAGINTFSVTASSQLTQKNG